MLQKRRLRKAAGELQWHLAKMDELCALRDTYDREVQSASGDSRTHLKSMALAVNYELCSHASRAIAALRAVEENAPPYQEMDADSAQIRSYLTSCISLPAIPRKEVGWHSADYVEDLYEQHYIQKIKRETGFDPS